MPISRCRLESRGSKTTSRMCISAAAQNMMILSVGEEEKTMDMSEVRQRTGLAMERQAIEDKLEVLRKEVCV